ncbi:Argininosuccinate lyase [Cladobotryum mycophilum]|uniref:Arginosuccinase n=1 Tax=Cladobotryum mycophilum TaxID=491253 RepID=A0ABR0SQX3_9HYPO
MPAAKSVAESFAAGRLSKEMCDLLKECNEKPRLEWEVKNLSTVTYVDSAHVVMLASEGHISTDQAAALLHELDEITKAGPQMFSIVPGHGSIVLQMERLLSERLGEDIAGRLPIARSRLDHGSTIRRISDRANILGVTKALLVLHESLIKVAAKHGGTAMISYTHLQQAQPATFGHYLLAFNERLQDSFDQLTEIYRRIDRCPLGAVGLSGTDLRINRQQTASLLGFSEVLDNSRLGRDSYYQIEATFALSMIMVILNDLCTDLHIYSSTEFGTIELDDSHCSTSSVFPQKKNPYGLETVKGRAGDAQGWVAAAMATFRNEGTGDTGNRNVSLLGDACKTTMNMVRLTAEVIEGLTVHKKRYEELLSKAWVTTNRLGNILLSKHGLNYRTAHGVVGRLVKKCLDNDIDKTDVTVDLLQEAAREMGVAEPIAMSQTELTLALDHTEFLRKCISYGSVGPKEFERLLMKRSKQHYENISWVQGKEMYLAEAGKQLDKAVDDVMSTVPCH